MFTVSTLGRGASFSNYIAKPLAISLVLAISAQINILTVPVPITMQPLVLLFIGLLASPTVATLSVIYYLTEIALGFPFASGFSGGVATLLSTRAGYFVGFAASVYVGSTLLAYSRSFLMRWVSATASTATLYTCGIAWLSILFGLDNALKFGLYPFLSEMPAFITIAVISTHGFDILSKKFKQ